MLTKSNTSPNRISVYLKAGYANEKTSNISFMSIFRNGSAELAKCSILPKYRNIAPDEGANRYFLDSPGRIGPAEPRWHTFCT
jgi:hypothetical protein